MSSNGTAFVVSANLLHRLVRATDFVSKPKKLPIITEYLYTGLEVSEKSAGMVHPSLFPSFIPSLPLEVGPLKSS